MSRTRCRRRFGGGIRVVEAWRARGRRGLRAGGRRALWSLVEHQCGRPRTPGVPGLRPLRGREPRCRQRCADRRRGGLLGPAEHGAGHAHWRAPSRRRNRRGARRSGSRAPWRVQASASEGRGDFRVSRRDLGLRLHPVRDDGPPRCVGRRHGERRLLHQRVLGVDFATGRGHHVGSRYRMVPRRDCRRPPHDWRCAGPDGAGACTDGPRVCALRVSRVRGARARHPASAGVRAANGVRARSGLRAAATRPGTADATTGPCARATRAPACRARNLRELRNPSPGPRPLLPEVRDAPAARSLRGSVGGRPRENVMRGSPFP